MLVFLILLSIISILLGSFTVRCILKRYMDLSKILFIGVIMMFFLFEILSVPMIISGFSLSALSYTWALLTGVLCVLGLVLNYNSLISEVKSAILKIREIQLLEIIIMVIILYQIYISYSYAYMSENDAYYVGTAVTAYSTDTMFRFSPFTGQPVLIGNYTRHILSPLPIFWAMFGRLFRTHPAIIIHQMVPTFFIPVVYMLYHQIGKLLFKNKRSQVGLFLLFLSVIYLFAGKVQGIPSFMLMTGIWQGEVLLTSFLIPFMIYINLLYRKEKNNKMYFLFAFFTFCSGVMVSIQGFAFCTMIIILILLSIMMEKAFIKRRSLQCKEF